MITTKNKVFFAKILIAIFVELIIGGLVGTFAISYEFYIQESKYLATKIILWHQFALIIAMAVGGCYYYIKAIQHLLLFIKQNK